MGMLMKFFQKKYDPTKDLKFNGVKFRPGAKRTAMFGVDISTTEFTPLRIHNAVDSAHSNSTEWAIFAPFDIERSAFYRDYGSFGTQTFLWTPYGFHLRLAHIGTKNIPDSTMALLEGNKGIYAGGYLFDCGNEGKSTGRHLHLEVVSDHRDSDLLEDILLEKYGENVNKQYTRDEMLKLYSEAGLSVAKGDEAFQKEVEKRGVTFINQYKIIRRDYHYQEMRTFYSSMALFGM